MRLIYFKVQAQYFKVQIWHFEIVNYKNFIGSFFYLLYNSLRKKVIINVFVTQGIVYFFNLVVVETIIGLLYYLLTGIIYERWEAPTMGSFYILLTIP